MGTIEILTFPISKAELWDELKYLAKRLNELQQNECRILFGFAWGNEYYPTSKWNKVPIAVNNLVKEVKRVESAGFGKLGQDDLFIYLPNLGLEFLFCNDSDIHLTFVQSNKITESFFQRWEQLGFKPAMHQSKASKK